MNVAQERRLAHLAARLGTPTHVNTFKPATAVWADFAPSVSHPYGSSWRITPDGIAWDETASLLDMEV